VDGGKLAIAGGIVISPLPLSSNVELFAMRIREDFSGWPLKVSNAIREN